jgi:hypothetical protein
MARDLYINLTEQRLVVNEANGTPQSASFTKGDDGVFNLYFLEATGLLSRPFEVVAKTGADVKLGIGSRFETPRTGTYTLSFSAETTSDIPAAATAGVLQTELNSLSAISSAGGVSVTGTLEDHFTVRFNSVGTQSAITSDVSQLIPNTIAIIDQRITGSATQKEVQEIQLRLSPAVFQDTWADIDTAITATLVRTITGSDTTNESQRLSFSKPPFNGVYQLNFPATSFTVDTAVTFGLFETTVTHGLTFLQRVTITGFSAITGYNRGQQYFVNNIPQPNQFTLSAFRSASGEFGGSTITGSAEATPTAGIITTVAAQTVQISAQATAAEVQNALQALDSIGSGIAQLGESTRTSGVRGEGGVLVTGVRNIFYDITFTGQKSLCEQPLLTVLNGTTAKDGKVASVDFGTFALRDLLGNNPSVALDLEIEVTENGSKQTVIQTECQVSEELIV